MHRSRCPPLLLPAHFAASAFKYRLDAARTLALDPFGRFVLEILGRGDTNQTVMDGLKVIAVAPTYVDAPQPTAACATEAFREIENVFREGF